MKVDISIKPIVYNLLNKRLKTIENKIYKELNHFKKEIELMEEEIFKLWERLRYVEDEIKITHKS